MRIQGGFEQNEYMVLPFPLPRHHVLGALYSSLVISSFAQVISERIYNSAIF